MIKRIVKILIIIFVLIGPAPMVFADVSFDNSTQYFAPSPSFTHTFSHTVSGSFPALYVFITNSSPSVDTVSSVSYNGVALTKIANQVAGSEGYASSWYLINPDVGTHDVVITSSNSEYLYGYAYSVDGADSLDSHSENSDSASSLTLTQSASNSGSWVVMGVRSYTSTVTSGTNFISRYSSSIVIGDPDVSISSGSISLTANHAGGTIVGMSAVFSPHGSGPPPPPPPSGVEGLISTASTTMFNDLGIGLGDVSGLMKSALSLVAGTGLGILPILLPFILALVIISIIVYFLFRGFRFFRH